MNANELADDLESWFGKAGFAEHVAMLRQQQVRIDHLLETQDYLYKRHDEQQAEIEALKAGGDWLKNTFDILIEENNQLKEELYGKAQEK